jgi:hypothetical protein
MSRFLTALFLWMKKTLDKRAILWYKSNNGCDGESSILNRLQRERGAVIRLTVVYEDRA